MLVSDWVSILCSYIFPLCSPTCSMRDVSKGLALWLLQHDWILSPPNSPVLVCSKLYCGPRRLNILYTYCTRSTYHARNKRLTVHELFKIRMAKQPTSATTPGSSTLRLAFFAPLTRIPLYCCPSFVFHLLLCHWHLSPSSHPRRHCASQNSSCSQHRVVHAHPHWLPKTQS